MQLDLEQFEIEAIIRVLGDLPTKSGAFPLVVKITDQLQQQLPKQETENE